MIGPSIEPSEVGLTGLVWLFLSYGYVLYAASNLISEGSELLLLIPSLAGLVGGVVLPLLGAVPDGAIILFSGLGDRAQETLSVGVGALAGSTIMLLTIPFALSIYGGRVDLLNNGIANYRGKPKLTAKHNLQEELSQTGVVITPAVRHGGLVMMLTTLPYFMIQVPALFLHGPTEVVADGEHWWSLGGLVVCLTGLFFYMRLQLHISQQGEDKGKRMAVVRKLLHAGRVSLAGAVAVQLRQPEEENRSGSSDYQSLTTTNQPRYPPPAIAEYLKEILADAFVGYDSDKNGLLDKNETTVFFRDFHETISEQEMTDLFQLYDTDKSGHISLDEFIGLAYALIKIQDNKDKNPTVPSHNEQEDTRTALAESAFAEIEEEEVPEEFTDLPPDQQQAAIKKRAFTMLFLGAFLVVLFSDPMVDVMQEIAVRANVSPFYVSFVLAPLASNASEVLASQYYASKKTSKTITVSLSTLEGAAAMNNTFCLSIFMGLIFVRGLAWQYTAETIAIIVVEVFIGVLVQSKSLSVQRAVIIGAIFPLSIALVATLEAFGFD